MVFFKLCFHLNKIYTKIKDDRAVDDAFHITNHQFNSIILFNVILSISDNQSRERRKRIKTTDKVFTYL